MIPQENMTGAYFTENCSLRIRIISYQPLSDNKGEVKFEVVKNAIKDSKCEYKEGKEYRQKEMDENRVMEW